MLGALAIASWLPYSRWSEGQDKVAALKAQEAQLASELVRLQERYLEVLGPVETERLARRRLGMVRGGERAYVLAAPDRPIERPPVVEPAGAAPEADTWWERSGNAVLRALRAVV